MKNEKAFHAPLHPMDTEVRTYKCRHTNPNICAKHYMPKVCAFARQDQMCLAPPQSWPKQFKKLKQEQGKKK